MAGVVLESVTSPEAVMRNLQRLNEALVAMQGGQIAMENIVGYEDLATKTTVEALEAALEKLKYKVGDIYISTSGVNPATHFGYGTWEKTGSGRALIGDGETTDTREDTRSFTAGDIGGEFSHKQTGDEVGVHNHTYSMGKGGTPDGSDSIGWEYEPGNPYGSDRSFATSSTGDNNPMNIMSPYLVVHIWKRTA